MDKSEFDISALKDALETLKVCSVDFKQEQNVRIREYMQDACIKRFEYTVETSWKIMKKYLKLAYGKSDKELTINNIFRFMESYGFIKSWEAWQDYYERRNDTSHEYNKQKAKQLITYVDGLILDVEYLCTQLEIALGE